MRGCGVRMMDQTVKANSRKDISTCKFYAKKIGIFALCILLSPFIIVFLLPYALCKKLWEKLPFNMALWKKVCICIPIFLLGLVLDVVVVPMLIGMGLGTVFYAVLALVFYILTCCKCFEPCRMYRRARRERTGGMTQAEQQNRQRALAEITRRKNAPPRSKVPPKATQTVPTAAETQTRAEWVAQQNSWINRNRRTNRQSYTTAEQHERYHVDKINRQINQVLAKQRKEAKKKPGSSIPGN